MAIATYSISPGTIKEAASSNNIIDVLDKIPDNTQKLITPRNVRDAIFSNWENSTFRYTTNGSTDYIGIGRDDIHNKMLFGKQKIGGSYVLASGLISSTPDTDIFFFNNKEDINIYQDSLKMSFLTGDSPPIHLKAPYMEFNKSGNAVSWTLAHDNPAGGDIVLQAGTGGNVSINDLIFPTIQEVAYMVGTPSGSAATDLILVRSSSSGEIELKSGSFATTSLTPAGASGSFQINDGSGSLGSYGLENSSSIYLNSSSVTSSGDNNTFIGVGAGMNNSAINNTFIGTDAGKNNTTGASNIFIGYSTALNNETGCRNIFIGNCAGFSNTIGKHNIFMGDLSGQSNTVGSCNTFIGTNAGKNNTTGCENIFIGNNSGIANTSGCCNTFIGNCAGHTNSTGHGNAFLGYRTGRLNTTGQRNTFIGNESGWSNTIGHLNTFIGSYAGMYNTTGQTNTFVGAWSGHGGCPGLVTSTTTNNTFIGFSSGVISSGHGSVLIGYNAGRETATASVFIGNEAGYANTTGAINTFVGVCAGRFNTTGFGNTFVGDRSGLSTTTGFVNTFIGAAAGMCNTTGSCNTFTGVNAGAFNSFGNGNTFIGSSSGTFNTTGSSNVFIGNDAGTNTTSFSCSIVIGRMAIATFDGNLSLGSATYPLALDTPAVDPISSGTYLCVTINGSQYKLDLMN